MIKSSRKVLWLLYQPYKWIFFAPFLVINTLFFGLAALVISTLVSQRAGSYVGGVVWSRINGFFTEHRQVEFRPYQVATVPNLFSDYIRPNLLK